jgi:2-polyprenyl-6-methoxyphenol hydroxylase-like FAD-dependent oxidoreductase
VRGPRVAIVGGGPGGLFLARLLRLHDSRATVTVYERNSADATFGFGVVFSERTLSGFREADGDTFERISRASRRWSHMELRYRGTMRRYGGFGFSAIARTTLLSILQQGAAAVGADLHFDREVALVDVADADIVVAGDGVNSAIRAELADALGFSERLGSAKYAWFGTTAPFEVVTFPFVETEHGVFAAHAYPYDETTATFVAEVDEATWRRAGMDRSTERAAEPGVSDLESKAYLETAFAEHLGGEPLLVNNSKWASFRVVDNARWHHRNVVLLGDAAHTAHFSVGSGTKMAMEDAIALARAIGGHHDIAAAFTAYERERRPAVARTQRWAEPSQRWWESFGRRRPTDPDRFAFHFITRTGAMTYSGLRHRDASAVIAAERAFRCGDGEGHALATPLDLGGVHVSNRLLAIAGDVYHATAFAAGGAGMVSVPVDALGPASARPVTDALRRYGTPVCARVARAGVDEVRAAAQAGFDLVEVVLELSEPPIADPRELTAAAAQTPLVVAADVTIDDVWSAGGDALVETVRALADAGVRALRLRATTGRTHPIGGERHLPGLALADRVRTETGLAITLTVPPGWALLAPESGPGDDFSTAAHVALVAGRIDLLATWPLPVALSQATAAGDGAAAIVGAVA